MKTLVFSDTHLTDEFVPEKFKILEKAINGVDQIIINGDFWDGYFTKYEQFVNSPWKKLLALLKKKKTIYLFGNHDKKSFVKNKKKFWTHLGYKYEFKDDGISYKFEHGNRLLPLWDDIYDSHPPKLIAGISRLLVRDIGIKFGKKVFINLFYRGFNDRLKKKIERSSTWNFFGHIHYPEIDKKNKYANSGFIDSGFASYIIIDGKKIILKEFFY